MGQAAVRKPRRRAPIISNGWCTLNRAATSSGLTRYQILVLAIARQIDAKAIAGQVVISEASLAKFVAERDGQAIPSGDPAPAV